MAFQAADNSGVVVGADNPSNRSRLTLGVLVVQVERFFGSIGLDLRFAFTDRAPLALEFPDSVPVCEGNAVGLLKVGRPGGSPFAHRIGAIKFLPADQDDSTRDAVSHYS